MPHKYYRVANADITEEMGVPFYHNVDSKIFYSDQAEEFDPADEITKEDANTTIKLWDAAEVL